MICLGGSTNFEEQIVNVLKKAFSVASQEPEMFKYLGLYIDQKNHVITLRYTSDTIIYTN